MLDQLRAQAAAVPVRVHEPPAEVQRRPSDRDPTARDELALDLDDVVGRRLIGLLREELAVLLDLVEEDVLGVVRRADGDAGLEVFVGEEADR